MTEEKKKEGKDNCPLSPTDWVMFLSGEINRKEESAFIATILTVVATLVGVMAGSIYAFMNINNIELALMVALSLIKFWAFILCVIIGLIVFEAFVLVKAKKKVESLEKLRRKIIFGEERDCIKIREEWWNIVSKKRIKFIRRCSELILGLVTGYRDSKYDKKN